MYFQTLHACGLLLICLFLGQASRSIISRGGQTIADERTNNRGNILL